MLSVWKRDRKDLEEHFPHHNWPIILGLVVVLNTGYAIFTPSIYQFITTGSAKSEADLSCYDDNSDKFWPGLGATDTVYAWVLMAYSLPETASMPLAGIMAVNVPYTITILFTCALYVIGGLFYGRATNVWMVIVGRGLIGGAAAFADVIVNSYIGEMGIRMDEIRRRQGKKPLKYILYVAYSFTMNGTFILAFGVTSIMSQFKDLEPYRWPGLFVAAFALLYAGVVVLTFAEPRRFRDLKSALSCKCLTGLSLSLTLKSRWKIRLLSYIYLVSCGYIIGQVYAIITTLVTPVLSDQLGFSVEYTSYYFIGVSIAFLLASVIQLITKSLKLDNRVLFGIAFLGCLIGVILMGDWQAIGHDPCSLGDDYISIGNSTMNNLTLNDTASGDGQLCSNSSLYIEEICEALSSSGHECFWNPQSRVTGEFCNTCQEECLSSQTALDFYQFGLGVLLISLSSPLGFVYAAAITSDITSVESQGTMLSLVIGSGAFARAISPLWLVESYELSGKHVYISMATTALCLFLILVSLLLLYKHLAPKKPPKDVIVSRHASVNFLATLHPSRPSLDLDDGLAEVQSVPALHETTL